MLKEPNLSDLRLFIAVAKHSSFINAARELGIAQTTVSKRIAILEESLGVMLLLRTTRSVKATEDGMKVLQQAQRISDAVIDLQEDLSNSQADLSGPIRISASARLARDYVAPALSKIKKRYPNVDIWLEIVDRQVNLITEGFHLDIRSGNAQEPYAIGHCLAEASRILCASPAYIKAHKAPQSIKELPQHQCIVFRDRNEPFRVWTLHDKHGSTDVQIPSSLASNDNDIVLSWAKDGHGIMIATDWFVAKSIQAGELVRVLPEYEQPVGVWAISTLKTNQSAKIRLVIDTLKTELSHILT